MRKTTIMLFIICLIMVFCVNPSESKEAIDNHLKQLKNDIVSLNLINGLYLSKDQLQQYLYILKEIKVLEDKNEQENNKKLKVTLNALTELKYNLEYNLDSQSNTPLYTRKLYNELKSAREIYQDNIYTYEQRLKNILTANQLEVIKAFKPCLIPPKNFRNPSRVGQVSSNDKVEKLLDNVRTLPTEEYLAKREKFFEKVYFPRYEKYIKILDSSEKNAEKQRLFIILDKCKTLSDIDFKLNKESIVKSLIPALSDPEKNKKKNELTMMAKVMLNTNMIPVIERRLTQAK